MDVIFKKELESYWSQNTLGTEWSFHQLAPYIGKLKSSIAKGLIINFTDEEDTIFDPYSGAGTIPFEAWSLRRNVIASDLNPYAFILTKSKLFPKKSLQETLLTLKKLESEIKNIKAVIDLRKVPIWVRNFFHPETLKEIIAWVQILKEKKEWFILSCLLGILHHQRPGFLSFPSSHSVPYLRIKKFPEKEFPEMYEYRSVKDRLEKKIKRAFRRTPVLDYSIKRKCLCKDSTKYAPSQKVDAIITSPPYMRQLDYGRDNRLRLWFLGLINYKKLDELISPKEKDFLKLFKNNLNKWKDILKPNGKCILILGDNYSKLYQTPLPNAIEKIAINEIGGYKTIFKMENMIPNSKRVRRNYTGSIKETILVFEKI